MANLLPGAIIDVHVGDVGRVISFQLTMPNRIVARDLSGYAAWVRWWYPDLEPHVNRAALVGGSNGLVTYISQGDEFPTVGYLLAQPVVQVTDWYGGGAPGRGFYRFSGDVVRFKVGEAA